MSIEQDPFVIDLRAKIDQEIDKISSWLSDGKCSTLEEYRKRTGKIIGFRAALILIDECVANYARDEDDE